MRYAQSALAGFVTAALTASSLILTAESSASSTINAATMDSTPKSAGRAVSDNGASDGTALALIPAASASTQLSISAASTVVIRAKGPQCGTGTMATSVDGFTRSSTQVGSGWSDYTVSSPISAGNHQLTITYTNSSDKTSDCDPGLRLDTISVVSGAGPTSQPGGSNVTPFQPASSFNTKIPAGAALDPKGSAMIARATRTKALNANLVEFAVPIYTTATSSPGTTVQCTVTQWGPCPFDGYQIPIPATAKASPGSDGAMVIVDTSSRRVYELWQAAKDNKGNWTASFGGVSNLDGSGWGGAGTGAGASRLAGVIRISEITGGVIPHALALQVDNACAGTFRAPAVKTDGTASRSDCIPEGAHVRLDPTVNLAALSLTPAERAVGKALQDYGGYVVDRGGAPLSVSFELDPTAAGGNSVGSAYQRAGLRWDYDDLGGLPLSQLQVLS